MNISVRSYLTAGLAAVVGASAIAMAPTSPSSALQTVGLPAPTVAEIALTGTSLPLEQIWNLLRTVPSGGGLSGLVNVLFSAVGTEFVTQALPLLTAVVTDAATYLGAALTDVIRSGGLHIDFPGIVTGVGAALGTGDFPGALRAVNDGLSAPITHVVQTVFGSAFQAFLTDKAGTVLGALPELLRTAVQKVLGLDIKPVIDAIATAVSGLLPGPGAAAPVGLATAEETSTIVCNMPAIRPTEPAPLASPAVSDAPVKPASAAAGSADVPVESTPAKAEATEAPNVNADAPVLDVDSDQEPAVAPARVAHRGAAASEGDVAASKPATGHRGAGDASPGRRGLSD